MIITSMKEVGSVSPKDNGIVKRTAWKCGKMYKRLMRGREGGKGRGKDGKR